MSSDSNETGWYPNEPQLAPSAVTSGDFGELFDRQLTGQIYAQPLISQPTVLAVTEDDNAYGLNSSTGAIKWQDNFGTPADPLAQNSCGDIGSSMGITGTPVIDPATGTAYFVAATSSGTGGATQYFMEAVNVQTGAKPAGWPAAGVAIQGSADADPGTVFDGQWESQRPGLILVNGVIYAAFSAQCDLGNWTGWLVGVSEASASITTMWASETGVDLPNGGGGGAGIWQSGSAPVVDSQGNIYVATGNGNLASPGSGLNTTPHNFGEAVVELSATGGHLHVVDWFSPSDAQTLNSEDGDLGSGGPVALPASMGTSQEPNVMLEVGKEGILYGLNMNALGGYLQGPGGSDAVPSESGPYGGVWSRPTVWPGDGGYVYVPTTSTVSFGTNGGALNVFQRMVSASGAVWFQLVGATTNSSNTFGFGSGAPMVTSNGTVSGSSLLWIIHDNDASGSGAQLQAYNPIPQNPGPNGTLQEVWHASIGDSTKFSEPGVDNGKIYVGTKDGTLLGFGLLAASTPALNGNNVDFTPTVVSQSVLATAQFTATTATTVTSFTETGTAFAMGTPGQALPATLSTGQSITVPITFTPNAVGALTGSLTANETSGTAAVTLSGQGLSATQTISASPSAVDFGNLTIGGPTVSLPASFTNVSASSVTITGFSSPALPFDVPNPPANGTLGPGATVHFTVDFTPPGSSGNFDHVFGGVATLETNAGNFGMPLSGSAAPAALINIVPSTLSFGNVPLGSSATLSFDVGNEGAQTLTITQSTPPTTNGFTATSSLPVNTQINANTSVQESVQFTPASRGPVSATWLLEGNDASGLQTVTITGTGVTASTDNYSYAPGGGTGTAPASGSGLDGTTITLATNTFTYPGHTFAGWNDTTSTDAAGFTYTLASNPIVFTAQWTVATPYTVTFNANLGTGTMANETASGPTKLTLNAFTRTGYHFAGWNTVANGVGGTAYADGALYPFTSSNTLYAQWSTGVIALVAGSTSSTKVGTTGAITVTSAQNVTSSANVLLVMVQVFGPNSTGVGTIGDTKTGTWTALGQTTVSGDTQFVLWQCTNPQAGVKHAVTWTPSAADTWGSLAVMAEWAGGPFTLDQMSSVLTSKGTTGATPSVTPSAAGELVLASAADERGTSAWTSPTKSFTALTTPDSANVMAYLVDSATSPISTSWKVSPSDSGATAIFALSKGAVVTYTVTYNYESGTGSPPSATYTVGGTALTLPTPTRTGYTFNGWFTAVTSGTLVGVGGASYTPTGSLMLYAQWTVATPYTVTFNANLGTGTMANETASGPTKLTLNAFTRTGYHFAGWNTVANGVGGTAYANGASYPFNANVTLYAQWSTAAAIALVAGSTSSTKAGTTGAITVTSAQNVTSSANVLLVMVQVFTPNSTGVGTISDTRTGTWTALGQTTVSGDTQFVLWQCTNPQAGVKHAVTWTPSAADTWGSLAVMAEWAGGPFTLDQMSSVLTSSGTTGATPSVTPSATGELVLASAADERGTSAWTSPTKSFTALTTPDSANVMAYLLDSATSPISTSWKVSPSDSGATAIFALY
jgi:uncharacterized repeat protein (TIGR02543 family)